MTDSKEQRAFTKDLIDAGYKTFKSEEENQILRKHNLSRDESLSNDKNRVYKDNTSGQAYVLYPGTKDKKDIGTDIAIGLGGIFTPIQNLTPRYREAKRVANTVKQKYGSEKVTAIGHSLGGGLAASSGIKKRITYNKAVGLSDLWRPVSSGQIDYRTKKTPFLFYLIFKDIKKVRKKFKLIVVVG
jgi:poly(3-hydroxyalkanoate) synthetase